MFSVTRRSTWNPVEGSAIRIQSACSPIESRVASALKLQGICDVANPPRVWAMQMQEAA
jgi:hypothetical protein